MNSFLQHSAEVAICVAALTTLTGCGTIATQRQDRAIAEFAKDSGFPSPSDVGFTEEAATAANRGDSTIVR